VTTEKKPSFLEMLKGKEIQVTLLRVELAPEDCTCTEENCTCDEDMFPATIEGILLDYNDSEILLREDDGGCVIISRIAVETVYPLTDAGEEDPFKAFGGN